MDTLKSLFPISDFLYILQLEEYESKRYFRQIPRFFFRRKIEKRGSLIYTKRVKITLALALPFCIIFFPLIPVWIGLSNIVLYPYFEYIKSSIQKKAAIYFAQKNYHTKVIAIAGSFGKTTTKNYIYELVHYNYKTQMIPGNINTPTGIANWIILNYDPTCELLIVEVDTYFIGEIKRSLHITPPDISVLTNVGDQHLERFENSKNLKKALLEVFEYSKENAVKIQNKKTNLDYALSVAKLLSIPKDIVKDTVKKLKKPDRRGDIKIINGFEVIDESYNISFRTAKNTVENARIIAKKKKKKLIVISAGIPELALENKDANKELGKFLCKKADYIILLQSIFYKDILNESKKFIVVKDLNDAWATLTNFDSNKYLILQQPELNDLYY